GRQHVDDVAQHLDRVCTGPARVGVGKVHADVAEARRAQERVGAGMSHDVGVAMTVEAAFAGERHPTEHQDAGRIVAEPVDVEALADPNVRDHGHFAAPMVRRAHSRSSISVIFRLVASPATTTTRPPIASTSAASSVAEPPCPWAARSIAARKACGVCTATRVVRSSVAVTSLPSTTLIVSVTASPGIAPSAPARIAAITEAYRSSVANGRAASWTQMIVASAGTAARPARTDSLRVAPPATPCSRSASAAGTTTTTPSD